MNQTIIYCKTTAPMFMAGAEKKKNKYGREEPVPEIRAASIKGSMRFIWRAIQCARDLKKLREAEGSMFGNAFGGELTQQSKLQLRIQNAYLTTNAELMTPHRELPDYDGQKAVYTQAFKRDGTFDVVISSFQDEQTHTNFVRLFVVTCLLYGFGRRSRKGFGTVAIRGIKGVGSDIDCTFHGVCDHLQSLSLFGARYKPVDALTIHVTADSPASYPYIKSIKIAGARSFDQTSNIIRQIGMATHLHAGNIFLGAINPRFASSVLLSTIPWSNHKFRCIVTQLHCTKDDAHAKRDNFNQELAKRDDFYKELDGRV